MKRKRDHDYCETVEHQKKKIKLYHEKYVKYFLTTEKNISIFINKNLALIQNNHNLYDGIIYLLLVEVK